MIEGFVLDAYIMMSMTKPVRLRFAPSPTGFLHIGGVRTALFNYLYAKQQGGAFILRLEDTDRERFVAEGVGQIVEVLSWLGLKPDEGYWEGEQTGDVGPYIQSERLPNYHEHVDGLVQAGLAYESNISADDFTARRDAAIKNKQAFVYRKDMEPTQELAGKKPIRLDMAAVATKLGADSLTWTDAVRGEFRVLLATLEDFILVKADGFPTYNFANVVDDHLMAITHISRGDEFISSTPKHAVLYDILEWDRPVWAHLPVILGTDGAKLSKRHGDTDALQYRDKGYLPEAILNFLALLGWNDGTEQELFTPEELIEKFSFERVQKSPAKFDLERLNWLNGRYIREALTEEEYLERALSELKKAGLPTNDTARAAVLLERERIPVFADLPDMVNFFLVAPEVTPEVRKLLVAKSAAHDVQDWLSSVSEALHGASAEHDEIETVLRDRAQELNVKAGVLFYAIRVAITGRTAAPGLFETIAALGIEETISRLKTASTSLNT